jgi:hypothetical protein
MAKPLIRRICTGVLVTAAILVAALGIYQGAYLLWGRRTVEYALSGRPGCDLAQDKLRKLGERAVPLIFNEMRDHPDGPQSDLGRSMLIGMAADRKLDPQIPYLGRVLVDIDEDAWLRTAASSAIGLMWYSEPARDALVDRILHDPSAEVRASCVGALGCQALARAERTNDWHVHPEVIERLTSASKDRYLHIRIAACWAVAWLAHGGLDHGMTLDWAEAVLAGCAKDSNHEVRRVYADYVRYVRKPAHTKH